MSLEPVSVSGLIAAGRLVPQAPDRQTLTYVVDAAAGRSSRRWSQPNLKADLASLASDLDGPRDTGQMDAKRRRDELHANHGSVGVVVDASKVLRAQVGDSDPCGIPQRRAPR